MPTLISKKVDENQNVLHLNLILRNNENMCQFRSQLRSDAAVERAENCKP